MSALHEGISRVAGPRPEFVHQVGLDVGDDVGLIGGPVHQKEDGSPQEVELSLELGDASLKVNLFRHGASVTASTGGVDPNGDIVGDLMRRVGTAVELPTYAERPGLDERLGGAGADVAAVRRMLRVQA